MFYHRFRRITTNFFLLPFQKLPERGPYGGLTAAGDGHAGAAAHPQFTGGELGRGGEVHHIGTVGLQKAFVGQQRLCHLGKGHPQRKGGHVLAAGKVEVDDVVGALQIFDVREGQEIGRAHV